MDLHLKPLSSLSPRSAALCKASDQYKNFDLIPATLVKGLMDEIAADHAVKDQSPLITPMLVKLDEVKKTLNPVEFIELQPEEEYDDEGDEGDAGDLLGAYELFSNKDLTPFEYEGEEPVMEQLNIEEIIERVIEELPEAVEDVMDDAAVQLHVGPKIQSTQGNTQKKNAS